VKDFINSKSSKKNKSRGFLVKPLLFVAGIISIFLLFIFIIRSIHFGDFFRNYERQTILLISDGVDKSGAYLLEADFSSLTINIQPLNTEVEIELGDYGPYRLQAVYPLLVSLEKKPLNLIRSTYSFSLGRVIDEVWAVDRQLTNWDSKSDFRSVFFSKEIWSFPSSLTQKSAWLSLISDPRTEVDFNDLESKYPLSKKIENTDSLLFLCSIALVNTTAVDGLAGQIETVLSGGGFSVIRTANDDQVLSTTEMILSSDEGSQKNCLKVERKIERLLPGTVEKKVDDEITRRYRADLVVKLGEDMKQ